MDIHKRLFWFLDLGVLLVASVFASSSWACFAVVVGKDASADGAILLGHNEQNGGQRFLNFRKIPRITHKDGQKVKLLGGAQISQVKESYAFLWSENPGVQFGDTYLNEWGVAIVSDACPDRGQERRRLTAEGQLVKGGIGYLLRRLVIERAKSAREGVKIAGGIIEEVGYNGSRTLVIADTEEAWLLSMAQGKQWVAQRVGDDQVVLLPNIYIIGELDLEDEANFLASPNLIKYAQKQQWYDTSDSKPFSFCQAYGQPRSPVMDPRQWKGQCLVTQRDINRKPDRQLPFSVKPATKLSVKDVINILRNHGEISICRQETQEAAVFQLRSNLPVAVGCIYWRASAEPCTSVLTPWYLGITETPQAYYKPMEVKRHLSLNCHFSNELDKFKPDDNLAWWAFKQLQDQVNGDRENGAKSVRAVWDEFETMVFADQAAVEKKGLELYRKDKSEARAYLTDYCRKISLQTVGKARELTRQFTSGHFYPEQNSRGYSALSSRSHEASFCQVTPAQE